MPNYADIIGTAYPDANIVIKNGDPTNYDDIQWISTQIPKATLDAHDYATSGIPSGKEKQFTFGDSEGEPLKGEVSSFKRVRAVQFEGTNSTDTPIKIRFTTWCTADTTGEIRLFDVTNNNVICTMEVTNNIEGVIETSNTTNWPADIALIEIQLRRATDSRTGNSKKNKAGAYLSGMVLVF